MSARTSNYNVNSRETSSYNQVVMVIMWRGKSGCIIVKGERNECDGKIMY